MIAAFTEFENLHNPDWFRDPWCESTSLFSSIIGKCTKLNPDMKTSIMINTSHQISCPVAGPPRFRKYMMFESSYLQLPSPALFRSVNLFRTDNFSPISFSFFFFNFSLFFQKTEPKVTYFGLYEASQRHLEVSSTNSY